MTRLRPILAAAVTALLFAAPAAATGPPSQMSAVELARAQERTYMQQPGRDLTAVELALALERTYMQQANAPRMSLRTATAAPVDQSTALVAGSIAAGLLLAAAGGLAAVAIRRRHAHNPAASLPAR